jgi:hypothetical protein
MTLQVKEFNPIEAKKERELELKKRRQQYPLPLSAEIRKEILRRCEILQYMGDCSISSIYYESTDEELVDRYSWVLDKEHDDLLAKPFHITL